MPVLPLITTALGVVSAGSIYALLQNRHKNRKLQEALETSNEDKQVLIEFLQTMAEDIAKGANKEAVYKRLVRASAFSCGALCARVFERTKHGFITAATEGLFPPLQHKVQEPDKFATRSDFIEDAIKGETLPLDSGLVAQVYNSGQAVFIRYAEGDSRIVNHSDDSIKISSLIAVPVMFQNAKYGVLVMANSVAGKSFRPTMFTLAKSLGEHGGLVLLNIDGISARIAKSKMENDLRLASSVQHYLLPENLPRNDKFAIAVKYFPHLLIGGDFYDVINMPDGKTGVVIADVSGKGVSAAILMAVAQSKLHYIAKMGLTPAQTLMKLNAEIIHSMRTDMFITITLAVIEADASKITIARAGHELPLIYKAKERKCVEIHSMGMAVGMVEPEIFDESIDEVSVDFDPNDILVLYTDGLTEAADSEGREYTAEALVKTVEKLAPNNVDSFNDKIIRTLEHFTGGNSYGDDLTLLSIKKI